MTYDFTRISSLFAGYGVRLVFTGDCHAQTITLRKPEGTGRFVYDIETGSFVSHPCPYGVIGIDRNQNVRVEGWNTDLPPPTTPLRSIR